MTDAGDDLLTRLVALAADASFDDLPGVAVAATQTFLLDTLAVGVAGRTGAWRDQTLRAALEWGTGGSARILGDRHLVPPATAAFMNACQMHCLEFDCVHEDAVAHVMTPVAAAALAETDRVAVDGRRLVLGVTLGVETAVALGVAARAPLRFFRPATVGAFGAAVAVGVLRGFDRSALHRCFGHALGQVAGTMQPHEEGKPTLPLQLGAAARAGLVAADLAAAGIPAPVDVLEGRHGYFALFETESDASDVVAQVGRAWRVTELSHKPWPTGRATHGSIEAVLRLRAVGVTSDNLAAMILSAPALIHDLVVRPALVGMEASYARLCFGYAGAVALSCGRVGIEHFTARELAGAQRLSLAGRFSARRSVTTDPAAFVPQELTARLRDGTARAARIDALRGSPGRPLSQSEQEAKVASCIGATLVPGRRVEQLLDTVRRLPTLSDARLLLDPLTQDAPR